MKQKEIINKFIDYIRYQNENTSTISADDFSQDRQSNMIVVGITNTEKIYPMTQDYKYILSVIVDSFIQDDPQGEYLNSLKNMIDGKIASIAVNRQLLTEIFEEIPIVGFIQAGKEFSINEASNRIQYTFQLFGSY